MYYIISERRGLSMVMYLNLNLVIITLLVRGSPLGEVGV